MLITGASANMGRLASLAFAREGANLAICTSTKVQALEQVAIEARALGAKVVAEKCDVTDHAAVAGFVQKAHATLGRMDVAVNLAGYRAEGKFLEETFEVWNHTIAVNLSGPFHICRNVIPHMQEQRWGRIINISGISPFLGVGAAKAMVKLGIVGFTRGLAREFGDYNITANCMAPGMVERPTDTLVTTRKSLSEIPTFMGRKGTPQEAISMLLYLASEDAGFVTGQCLQANGGSYLQ